LLTYSRTLLHGIIYLDLQKFVQMKIYEAQILTSVIYELKL
jgi:hypothetical protein